MSKIDEPLPDDFDFSKAEEIATPTVVAATPPLPYIYDERDSRCVDILNKVSTFCGKEFTEVPPNPDDESSGDIMPLDDNPAEDDNDKNGDGIHDVEIPGSPAEPYPDFPSDYLDKLREAYKNAKEKNLEEKKSYWAEIWQAIRFISNATCWTENATDTFIVQVRSQIYQAKQINSCSRACCRCDEDQIVIPLEYTPLYYQTNDDSPHVFNAETDYAFVGGIITAVVNGKPIRVKIDDKYLNEHYDPSEERIYIMRDDFPEMLLGQRGECCCLCLRNVTITLYYNAGYQTVPDALLPVFCPLIARIEDSKLAPNACAMAMTQVSGLLKSKKVGDVQYTWSDKDSEASKTQALYTELFNIASIAEINSLSRCDIVTAESAGEVI